MTHVPTMIQAAADAAARELLAGQDAIELPIETLRTAAGMIAEYLPSQDLRMIEAAVAQEFSARLTIRLRGLDDDRVAERLRALLKELQQCFPTRH